MVGAVFEEGVAVVKAPIHFHHEVDQLGDVRVFMLLQAQVVAGELKAFVASLQNVSLSLNFAAMPQNSNFKRAIQLAIVLTIVVPWQKAFLGHGLQLENIASPDCS